MEKDGPSFKKCILVMGLMHQLKPLGSNIGLRIERELKNPLRRHSDCKDTCFGAALLKTGAKMWGYWLTISDAAYGHKYKGNRLDTGYWNGS